MKNLIYLIVMVCIFTGCNIKDQDEDVITEKKGISTKKTVDISTPNFATPTQIDSSEYVMFPLNIDDEEKDYRIKSYGEGGPVYWNIAFYNISTQEARLLDSTRKMAIHSYTDYKQFIVYNVVTHDLNRDGKLDKNDPTYLFVSDKLGKNYKQISPSEGNVVNWQPVKGSNKILLQVIQDSNNDKKLNEKDIVVPMVYDFNGAGLSKEIFSETFQKKISDNFKDKWLKKQA